MPKEMTVGTFVEQTSFDIPGRGEVRIAVNDDGFVQLDLQEAYWIASLEDHKLTLAPANYAVAS